MKRIVGLVLASVMALGTTAFAAGNVDTKAKKVAKKPVAARKMKQQTGQTDQNMQQTTKKTPTKKTVAKSKKHSTKRHRASHKSSKKRTHKSTKKTMAPTKTKS